MVEDHGQPEAASRRPRKDAGLPAIGVLGGDGTWSVMALLRAAGISVAEVEPAPKQINETLAARFQFGYASARCGTLGDLRQILQLVQAATGGALPKNAVWTAADGSFIDGFRPAIEPYGFASKAELASYRAAHLACVLKLLQGVTTLVLPLRTATGFIDASDGTAYPALPAGAKLPRGCKLEPVVYNAETMTLDFAALHAALKALSPSLVIRLVVASPVQGLAALGDQAQLRGLAAHCAASFADVIYDSILDQLLARMAQPDADARLGPVVQTLMAGGDLLDAVAAAPAVQVMEDAEMGIPAPIDAPPREKRDRAQRKADRAKGKSKDGAGKEGRAKGAKVMCEDELLEAFS
ncbi:hypothetical protein GCM10010873_10530 [Cypionkella aquatica]|uniref:Uncharacterized protein n=1 Tax=Cypionkella aquatica TaxID=1756042 RepID=A0AA37U273_9RHOB|nr:hypothetical protein [Cypionkella aquatica]GLS86079.1 hypothetical protein GCM10010873_10530 [Cypionkella aquatica]